MEKKTKKHRQTEKKNPTKLLTFMTDYYKRLKKFNNFYIVIITLKCF